jgi:hypothetical protein
MEVKHRSNEKVLNNFAEVKGDASFFDFSWGSGQVTEGEKTSAERGAAARGTYGAKRDRCNRGKSCGAACIFYQKDCVLELPVNVQNAIRGARAQIYRKMSRGEISEEEANKAFLQATNLSSIRDPEKSLGKRAKDVEWTKDKAGNMVRVKGKAVEGQLDLKDAVKAGFDKGDLADRYLDTVEAIKGSNNLKGRQAEEGRAVVKGLREQYPDPKERSAKIRELFDWALEKGYGSYGEGGQYRPKRPEEMTEDFAKGVLNNQPFIRQISAIEAAYREGKITTPQYNQQMGEAVRQSLFTKAHSDAEVLMMSAFLSPGARAYLSAAGKVTTPNQYDTRFPGLTAQTVGDTVGTDKATKRMWMMQNLKNMMDTNFQEVYSKLQYKIHQVDMEHLTPESEAKRYGGANVGGNKSFAFSKANQTRSNSPLTFFLADNAQGLYNGKNFNQDGSKTVSAKSGKTGIKADLERDISTRARSVNDQLKIIAAIPAKDLGGADRAAMISKIVAEYAKESPGDKALSRSVTLGKQEQGLRTDQSYSWFGGKAGGWSGAAALGNRMAEALGRWQNEGDEGAKKAIALKGLMDRTSRKLLDIGAIEVNGEPLRRQWVNAPGVKEILKPEFESRMQSMMPEFDALLGP